MRKRRAQAPPEAPKPSTPTVPPSADGDVLSEENVAATAGPADGSESTGVFFDAWTSLRGEAEALPAGSLVQPKVPVRDAALLGLRVANAVANDAALAADYASLGATRFFDARLLRDLPARARALLYVRSRADHEADPSTAAPPALVEHARTLRTRMLKVLGFYFDEEGETGRELATIRAANGHAPLAGALLSLAALYQAHEARIAKTPEHYRATDARDATAAAEAIVAHLTAAEAPEATWAERQARVWTLFVDAYDEVCAAARFMQRDRDDLDARFPSLHALNVARRAAGKKAAAPTPAPDPADDPK